MGKKTRNRKSSKFDKEDKRNKEPDKQSSDNGKEGSSETDSSKMEKSKTNDPEWYARDPQLLLDAGNIPMSDVFGGRMTIPQSDTLEWDDYESEGGVDYTVESVENITRRLPGIMTFSVKHSVGDASDRNSPVNVAAQALYTHVRYVNSGRKNYDQNDLMMFCLTMSDIYSFITWLGRIYNCAFIFSQRNLYIGKALLEAQNIDPNIVTELANLRYWINVFISKVASFAVPASLYLFKKRAFMFQGIYTESPSENIKDQLYMYVPDGFYQFGTDDKGKGCLKYKQLNELVDHASPNGIGLQGLVDIGNALLASVSGDEDFGLMSGDILRAFQGDIITLMQLGTEGGIIPVYDPVVLHQMMNTKIYNYQAYRTTRGYKIDLGDSFEPQFARFGDIMQDAVGNIVYHEAMVLEANNIGDGEAAALISLLAKPIINLESAESDPAIIVESTRNMAVFNDSKKQIPVYELVGHDQDYNVVGIPIDCGDSIVVKCEVWEIHDGLHDQGKARSMMTITSNVLSYDDTNWSEYGLRLSKFRYAPRCAIADFTIIDHQVAQQSGVYRSEVKVTEWYPLSDLTNYTLQSNSVIRRLHELSMLSLLYVPGVAKQINYKS